MVHNAVEAEKRLSAANAVLSVPRVILWNELKGLFSFQLGAAFSAMTAEAVQANHHDQALWLGLHSPEAVVMLVRRPSYCTTYTSRSRLCF